MGLRRRQGLLTVFDRHADYEYETLAYDGAVEKVLFGDAGYVFLRIPIQEGEKIGYINARKLTPETIPFFEEFREAFQEYAKDVTKMLALCFVASRWHPPYYQYGENKLQPWFHELVELSMFATYNQDGRENTKTDIFIFRKLSRYCLSCLQTRRCLKPPFRFCRAL